MLKIVPLAIKQALPFVWQHHRHNRKPNGGLFAAGVEHDGVLVGVAIAARPVARMMWDGFTVEITRVCVVNSAPTNTCSMLYGAVCRAAKALGYTRAITYTLAEEPGTSLRASGFEAVAELAARPSWASAGTKRQRIQTRVHLFGEEEMRPAGPKTRWQRML